VLRIEDEQIAVQGMGFTEEVSARSDAFGGLESFLDIAEVSTAVACTGIGSTTIIAAPPRARSS